MGDTVSFCYENKSIQIFSKLLVWVISSQGEKLKWILKKHLVCG